MIHDRRSEFEDTPEGRIAAAANAVVRSVRRKYEDAVPGVSGNRIYPDFADFRQGLALYVQREVLAAEWAAEPYAMFVPMVRRKYFAGPPRWW